ncbi:AAR2 protein [Pelomyxa schiedti]|nr:AAR2 protein [Pelomyxa schiedti]
MQPYGYVVCRNVTRQLEFGVDEVSYRTVAPRFMGTKLVPMGLHLVHYSMPSSGGGAGMGLAFFVKFSSEKRVVVVDWDDKEEDFKFVRDEDEIRRMQDLVNTPELDQRLGAYPIQHMSSWNEVSDRISEATLHRCAIPPMSKICSGGDETRSSTSQSQQVIPFFEDAPRIPKFSNLSPPKPFLATLSPTERTQYHHDGSGRLEWVITTVYGGNSDELLSELQLSYVLFLYTASFSALEQWKEIVKLLCSCQQAIGVHAGFFFNFLCIVQAQLGHAPKDFFVDPLTDSNFLLVCLHDIFEVLGDPSMTDPALKSQSTRLLDYVQTKFGVNLMSSDATTIEEAPVVVEPETAAAQPKKTLTSPAHLSFSLEDE